MTDYKNIMTSKEVMVKYRVSKSSMINWRRGFYYDRGHKVWFFSDHSHLEYEWNENLLRMEYNPVRVAVWVRQLQKKREGDYNV